MQDSGVDDTNNVPYLETHFETYREHTDYAFKENTISIPRPPAGSS